MHCENFLDTKHINTSISIIVPTFNRREFLKHLLTALKRQTIYPEVRCEILVIDDCSTDGTQEMLKALLKNSLIPVRCLAGKGRGDAAARNLGAQHAKGEWLAFIDDDEIPMENWLYELVKLAYSIPAPCVGGARKLQVNREAAIAKMHPGFRMLLGEEVWSDKPIKYNGKILPNSGNLLVRKELLVTFGGFNESLARGGADYEMARRIRAAGCCLWFAPDAIVYHRVQTSRINREYFIWLIARRWSTFALLDYQAFGIGYLGIMSLARFLRTVALEFPGLLLLKLLGQTHQAYWTRSLVWRTEAYCRQMLKLLAPTVFSQKSFFKNLELRRRGKTLPGLY